MDTNETQHGGERLAAPAGSANLTLTAQEIRHLAEFCGMVIRKPTAEEAEDERETEIVIAPWPQKGVQGDDGMLLPHKHIAYYEEYPEEGCIPLGSPNAAGDNTENQNIESAAVSSSRLLGACPKCGKDRGGPVLRSAPNPAFYIECGHCGHHSTEIDLKPAIESWNAPNS